jgi:hypothetical protein
MVNEWVYKPIPLWVLGGINPWHGGGEDVPQFWTQSWSSSWIKCVDCLMSTLCDICSKDPREENACWASACDLTIPPDQLFPQSLGNEQSSLIPEARASLWHRQAMVTEGFEQALCHGHGVSCPYTLGQWSEGLCPHSPTPMWWYWEVEAWGVFRSQGISALDKKKKKKRPQRAHQFSLPFEDKARRHSL